MTSYQPVDSTDAASIDRSNQAIPRIDLNLWDHKLPIAIHWTILFISSGVLPIVLYFALRYGANLGLSTVLAVTTAIFGVVTLFSLAKRSWLLLKVSSICRPLGASRFDLDYFHWNFLVGFVSVTAIIIAGNITKNIRIVTLGLPILLIGVCGQLLIAGILRHFRVAAPFRMSSVSKGDTIRSGVYAIAEDIVAVDGMQGQQYRRQLQNRYLNSRVVQSLCLKLDLLWGMSGLGVAAACFALIFALENANVAYTMGWVIPWGYAATMTLVTIKMTAAACKQEERMFV